MRTVQDDHLKELVCMRCFVSGRVQGVFYRASTRAQALTLGLSGFARNLDDGRVEVLACGDIKALKQLEAWLWQGPPGAQVHELTSEFESFVEQLGFETC